MPKTLRVAALGLALGLTGCVSLGTYKTLQQQSQDLQKQTSDLQSQLDEIHREASGLQSDLGHEKQSNNKLSASKTELELQRSALEATEASLESKTAELETKTAQLETKTSQLEQAQSELAVQNAALRADKAALLKQAQDKQAQYDGVMGDLKKEVSAGQLKITQYKNMLTLDVADQILFASGQAALKPKGRAVLRSVAKALARGDKIIRVVGHTDNVPLGPDAAYSSNWDLSTARATTVVRFLQEQCKIAPTRLVAEGRGEWEPVASNDTAAGRQKNRRIEITLIDRSLVDGMTAPAPSTARP